ncbi:DUF2975 domain-containing protein [Janibacter sp. LM]|uniref:DUF2975 domain-containing protein n=1 Tax=Janibacter sp. LM TaxID=3144845 RepID=UPI0031F6F0D6
MTSIQVSAGRGLRLRGAELLLWVAIASSAAFGLSAVAGPNGLGLMTVRPEWPVIGSSAYQMSIRATFDDDAGVSVANAPGWKDTSDGTRDAVTGGPPVEITGPFVGSVGFLSPTLAMRWAWVCWQAAGPLLAAGSLLVVLKLVRSVRTGTPFTSANARRLRVLALLVGGGGTILAVTDELVRRWLLDGSAAAGIVGHDWHISFAPVLLGVLIGVVAEVWRAGVAMAEDLDGVV